MRNIKGINSATRCQKLLLVVAIWGISLVQVRADSEWGSVEDGGFGPHLPPFDEVKVPYKNAVMVNHAIFKVELKKDNSTTLVFTRMDKDEQFLNDIFQEDDPYSKAISQDTLVLIRQAYAQKIPVHHNIKQFGSLMVISTVLPMIT